MASSKKARISLIITSIALFIALVAGGVAMYIASNAPIWERKSMTFDKLKPLVTAYSQQHEVMSYVERESQQRYSNSKTEEDVLYYERSNEYIHLKAIKSNPELSFERYIVRSRPLIIEKYGSNAVILTDISEKTGEKTGDRKYNEYVNKYSPTTAGVMDLFSKPTLTYKDDKYYLKETSTFKELFSYFETNSFISSVYKSDPREATIEAVVDAKTNALISYDIKAIPYDSDNLSIIYYSQSHAFDDISYEPVDIQLKDEFKAVLPK